MTTSGGYIHDVLNANFDLKTRVCKINQ